LYVFGCGLALIIPFLVLLQAIKEGLSFGTFVLIFVVGLVSIMAIVARIAGWAPPKNSWIFIFQLEVLLFKMQHGAGAVSLGMLGLAAVVMGVTLWRVDRLKAVYVYWMKGAGLIGSVVSGVALGLIFYLVFAPVGLILRLIKKDPLDTRLDPNRATYWQKREYVFDKENYKRQF